jgi:DNA-binding cell septation regulator SpoVG
MNILRMNPYEGDSKTAAFFDVETAEGITIKGFTLVEGPKGLFVSMPSEKGKDDKYYDKVSMTNEKKKSLSDMAVEKYNELTAL